MEASQVLTAIQYHTTRSMRDVEKANLQTLLASALPPAATASIGGASIATSAPPAATHRVDLSA